MCPTREIWLHGQITLYEMSKEQYSRGMQLAIPTVRESRYGRSRGARAGHTDLLYPPTKSKLHAASLDDDYGNNQAFFAKPLGRDAHHAHSGGAANRPRILAPVPHRNSGEVPRQQ
jgi:hypothetical protein